MHLDIIGCNSRRPQPNCQAVCSGRCATDGGAWLPCPQGSSPRNKCQAPRCPIGHPGRLLQIGQPAASGIQVSDDGSNPAFFSQLAGLFAVGVFDDPLGIYSFSTVTRQPHTHRARRRRRQGGPWHCANLCPLSFALLCLQSRKRFCRIRRLKSVTAAGQHHPISAIEHTMGPRCRNIWRGKRAFGESKHRPQNLRRLKKCLYTKQTVKKPAKYRFGRCRDIPENAPKI